MASVGLQTGRPKAPKTRRWWFDGKARFEDQARMIESRAAGLLHKPTELRDTVKKPSHERAQSRQARGRERGELEKSGGVGRQKSPVPRKRKQLSLIYSFIHSFIYFERFRERERVLLSAGSRLKWLGLETELQRGLPHRWQRNKNLRHHLLSP